MSSTAVQQYMCTSLPLLLQYVQSKRMGFSIGEKRHAVSRPHTRMLHTHASTHIQSKRNSRTAEARTAQRLLITAEDSPNSSSSSTRQRWRPATSERASYRPFDYFVPWWLRVVQVCHVCCVVCRLCCVTCAVFTGCLFL